MNDRQHIDLLQQQINLYKKENRHLEFKSNHLDSERLGRYISALSNGACLDNKDNGYLYFGVEDGTLELKGTTFDASRTKAKGNQDLEIYLRQYVSPKIDFKIEAFKDEDGKRFVVFIIPAAKEEPTCFMGTPYVRVDSSVADMRPYTDWMRTIYNSRKDWSAEIVPEATVEDLDRKAIQVALDGFCERFPNKAENARKWDIKTFLDKAKLTIDGRITRTALLLLGKEEAAHYLNHIAQIVWRLREGDENAGDILTTPFLLSTTKLMEHIRNYRMKIFPNNSLIPVEIWKYDTRTILEGLHNCILHQDYLRNERIVVTEESEQLLFENAGSFYDGTYTDYIEGKKTPKKYRNPFLAQAMVNLRMIDTQGYGIHEMFESQKKRYLPMPDYDLSDTENVRLVVPGHVIDKDYSLLLMEKANLDITTVFLLDRVQKGKGIPDNAIAKLRKEKLIEGRKGSLFIGKRVATATHQEAEYIDLKGFDDQYYRDLIVKALSEHDNLKRADFDKLLLSKLPKSLNPKQKTNKIDRLLRSLRSNGKIFADEHRIWHLRTV
ncbi:MAG: putative DNA binding domain-containing protein [Prevotella sp.]|nr:putative DNA binding domain-containing protein [Prevotella sp.]